MSMVEKCWKFSLWVQPIFKCEEDWVFRKFEEFTHNVESNKEPEEELDWGDYNSCS